ncbi:hypothetical protein PL321_15050 [Caloramator sp. mosi_1]|uniref:hypothetical protein n=1 Tax=Caloramator sp. mosi_1 TaxID=3023090 RepID=UPI002362B429|nr:hypothetical protein [Caloramator sp. mosi_1]WDC83805.1 hypothetical protein PL321_15050 [Caloramator sp. mosi_1]
MRQLNDILKYDDYEVYKFLVSNKNTFSIQLLLNTFKDKRIDNFIKNINYKIHNDKILNLDANERKDFIINETVKYLISMGGKNV